MDCRPLILMLLLLAGCTAPVVQPPPAEDPPGTGVFVTVADYEGSLALRFELKGEPGTECTWRQNAVEYLGAPGIEFFIIREGDPSHTYGGYSQHRQFVQVGDQVDTRDFGGKGDAAYSELTNATVTLEWRKEVYVLVFGNLAPSALSPVPGKPTLHAGFDCHKPDSTRLLGAGTEVVPILFDRFNSTAAVAVPRPAATFLDSRVMVNGTLSATFQSPLVEVRMSGLAGNDLAQVTLTHPNGTEDWTVLPTVAYDWDQEFFGGPGTYTLDITQAQGDSWWGVMMGFDAPEKLTFLNATRMKVPHVVR